MRTTNRSAKVGGNLIFLAVAALCCVLSPSIRATTIIVTNTADSGAGSLRAALANAADGDTIDFSVAGTILLTNGELLVTNNLSPTSRIRGVWSRKFLKIKPRFSKVCTTTSAREPQLQRS